MHRRPRARISTARLEHVVRVTSPSAQSAFRNRNFGGALTVGYVVVFTDGRDTARIADEGDVLTALAASPDELLAVT